MARSNATAQAGLVKVDYEDRDGIKRRVLIPEGMIDYSEGIPVSLSVDSLYRHCPIEYKKVLTEELWARGLIEPCDYLLPGAAELITAAIRAAVKHDALDIVSFAREDCKK